LTRADWLNLAQAALVGLQYFNLQMTTSTTFHVTPLITWAVGAFLASATMFVHLMGVNTPTQSQVTQLGLNQHPTPGGPSRP
jgi:hypothetical protein